MNPRIERIKVKRGGPLEKDFEIQPGDLNLVYGLNETGKTYLLESLVRLLFKPRAGMRPSGICGNGIQTESSWCPV